MTQTAKQRAKAEEQKVHRRAGARDVLIFTETAAQNL